MKLEKKAGAFSLVREKFAFPKGFCLVDNRSSFEDVIQTVENIPRDLMPPSFKKAEDFVRDVMKIEHGHRAPQEADRGKTKQVCHWGQTAEEAVKDFDLHGARLAIEYGLDGGHWHLRKIKHLLDEDFYDKWIKPVRQNPNVAGRVDLKSELFFLASEVYNGKRKDFEDDEIQDLYTERELLYNSIDHDTMSDETVQQIREERAEIYKKANALVEGKKQHIKDQIHIRAVDNWYDKYAWDFSKEERKKLDNPYALERETKDGKKIWVK